MRTESKGLVALRQIHRTLVKLKLTGGITPYHLRIGNLRDKQICRDVFMVGTDNLAEIITFRIGRQLVACFCERNARSGRTYTTQRDVFLIGLDMRGSIGIRSYDMQSCFMVSSGSRRIMHIQ